MLTVALKVLNTKGGIAGIGVILLLCAWGWHKASVGILEFEISGLKKEIITTEGKVIEQQNLKKVCELNLVGTRSALDQQNNQIANMEMEADQLVAAATARAIASMTSLEDVERKVAGPPGHEEMNLFLVAEFGRTH